MKSLRIEPGTTTNIQKPHFYKVETEPEPFTAFVWKYRAREDLEQMGGADYLMTLAYPVNWPDVKDETDGKGKGRVKEEVKIKEEPGDEDDTTKTQAGPRPKEEHGHEEYTMNVIPSGGQ